LLEITCALTCYGELAIPNHAKAFTRLLLTGRLLFACENERFAVALQRDLAFRAVAILPWLPASYLCPYRGPRAGKSYASQSQS